MRQRLMTAPRWAICLVTGVVYGGLTSLLQFARGEVSFAGAALSAVLGGLFFGVLFGSYTHRRNQDFLAETGQVVPSRTARRASWRGPAPRDPEDRRLASAILDHQLHELDRQRVWAPVLVTVLLAGSVWLALTDSLLWWGATAVFAAFLLLHLWARHRLTRRRALLDDAGGLQA